MQQKMFFSSLDGQLFDLSEPAAQLSQTLTNALDDSAGDASVPVPLGFEALANIANFLERTVVVVERYSPPVARRLVAAPAPLRPDPLGRPAVVAGSSAAPRGGLARRAAGVRGLGAIRACTIRVALRTHLEER